VAPKGVVFLRLPDYIGPCAFGIKMGVIVPGSDLLNLVLDSLQKVNEDVLLADRDVICITESVLARAQENYVTITEIGQEVARKLNLAPTQKIGVLFPIFSRNRFAPILEGIASAVPSGEVIVQLSFPKDEVGNQLVPPEVAEKLQALKGNCLTPEDLGKNYTHPITGVDYMELYRQIIAEKGVRPTIVLSNDPLRIVNDCPDAVIVADVHNREKTRQIVAPHVKRCITLQDLFNKNASSKAWSEWGLLGSNMSYGNKLKLAPRQSNDFVLALQEQIYQKFGKKIEILIYGDGAYKDPSSGIYELADPCAAFGATPGINGLLREGVKYKYLIDKHHENGKSEEEILMIVEEELSREREANSIEFEGTTPRRMEDILASLADLLSGSADAGTPMILVKNFLPE
jgi:hypothetical protein